MSESCSLPRIHRPCDECPWRKDAEPGRFSPERWESLKATSYDDGSAAMDAPIFACHKTDQGRDRTCAGWLAIEGANHVGIRVKVLYGQVPGEALSPGPGWPELFSTFAEAAEHDMSQEWIGER